MVAWGVMGSRGEGAECGRGKCAGILIMGVMAEDEDALRERRWKIRESVVPWGSN